MHKFQKFTSKNFFLLTCMTLLSSCGIQNLVSKTTNKNSPIIETVPAPASITPLQVSQIRASNNFTCGEKKEPNANNNSIYCWGRNEAGQLGNTVGSNTLSTPVELKGLIGESQSLALGNSFGCWLSKAFDLRCWGKNDQGQLGNSAVTSSREPLNVIEPYPDLVDLITASGATNCVSTDKGIQCWGQNFTNTLGTTIAINTISSQPVTIPRSLLALDDSFVKISSSGNAGALAISNAALTKQGRVFCWGSNVYGTCGMGNATTALPYSSPAIPGNALVKDMTVNRYILFVLTTNSTFLGSGMNNVGQLGIGTTVNQTTLTPVTVVSGSSVRSLPSGQSNGTSCIVMTSGTVKCWGINSVGQVGNNNLTTPQMTAQDVVDATGSPLSGIVQLGLQWEGACALKNDGSVWCWGRNHLGQLGNNNSTAIFSFATNALFTKKVKNISTGLYHSCAILEDDIVQCWGAGINGRLGTNSTTTTRVPTTVTGLAGTPISLVLGELHTCALLESRLVQCWGGNSSGVLGDNNLSLNRLRPSNILPFYSGNGAITSVATGGAHTCILANDVPKCFGWNADGQLGIGTNTNSSAPNYVVGLPVGISQMSLGDKFSCFLGRNSLVYCTGDNTFGQLGNITTVSTNLPVSSAISSVTALAAGKNHICAIVASGSLFCWGDNRNGQLGDGSIVNRTNPTLISGLKEKATQVTAGGSHSCALTETAKVFCFGSNYFGQLGNNSDEDYLLPVEVSSLTDKKIIQISAGENHTCAVSEKNETYCWGANESSQLGNNATTNSPIPILVRTP